MARFKMTWLVGVISALALVGLACDDEGDKSDLPSSSGGGSGGGSSTSTSNGTAGGGGSGGTVGCEADVPISGMPCAPEGQLCSYGNTCCQCQNLGECIVWACANPDNNDQEVCPMVTVGTPCGDGPYNPLCNYCDDNGVPNQLFCDLNINSYQVGQITECQ